MGAALHVFSELITEAGASALRYQLTNLQHLIITSADPAPHGNDFHGRLDIHDSEWEFISSLPNLKQLQFYEFSWISGQSSVQMKECFRKVNILGNCAVERLVLFPEDIIEEFGNKMPNLYLPHALSSDITELCPNVEEVYIEYGLTFNQFLNISALPKIRDISIAD